ncbi:hypothetical protein BH20ACT8_BH20ACT8_18220 [soil metagenome]
MPHPPRAGGARAAVGIFVEISAQLWMRDPVAGHGVRTAGNRDAARGVLRP